MALRVTENRRRKRPAEVDVETLDLSRVRVEARHGVVDSASKRSDHYAGHGSSQAAIATVIPGRGQLVLRDRTPSGDWSAGAS